jgi:hypothetical protein
MNRCLRAVECAAAVEAHTGHRFDAAGFRDRHVQRVGLLVEDPKQPQRGRAAGHGTPAGVQQRRPNMLHRIKSAGEGGVHAGVDALPATVVDVGGRLGPGQPEFEQLTSADEPALLLRDGDPERV